MNILAIRFSALGDVAMTIPAIYSVAKQYPEHTIKILTLQPFAQIFIDCPKNIILLTFNKQEIHGAIGLLHLLKRVNHEDIDVVADLHNVLRSWLIDLFFMVKGFRVVMVDKNRWKRLKLLFQRKGQQTAFTESYFNVFRTLGLPIEESFLSVLSRDISIAYFSVILNNKGRKKVGIAPFARYQNKTYPLKQMEQVVAKLSASDKFVIFLFSGGKTESRLMQVWESKYEHVFSIAGRYNLADEVRLMSFLDVMVSMDSANMHLASLVGTRVISLWGSTTPLCGFMGWKQKEEDAIQLNTYCQPCTIAGSDHCNYGDFHCLSHIIPETIFTKIMSITSSKC